MLYWRQISQCNEHGLNQDDGQYVTTTFWKPMLSYLREKSLHWLQYDVNITFYKVEKLNKSEKQLNTHNRKYIIIIICTKYFDPGNYSLDILNLTEILKIIPISKRKCMYPSLSPKPLIFNMLTSATVFQSSCV